MEQIKYIFWLVLLASVIIISIMFFIERHNKKHNTPKRWYKNMLSFITASISVIAISFSSIALSVLYFGYN